MNNKTDRISGAADQIAGKAKEVAGRATRSKELEARGLAQEAKGHAEYRSSEETSVERGWHDHTILIVSAILILTVLIQVILVKSWT